MAAYASKALEQKRQAALAYLGDRWVGKPGGHVAPGRQAPVQRGYNAAKVNRLTSSWRPEVQAPDQLQRMSLDALRGRSRDLSHNSDFVKKFLRQVTTNIVGPEGFKLQTRVKNADGSPDAAANKAIEAGWKAWCRVGVCDISGRLDFNGLCRATVRQIARDGEALVRRVRSQRANRFGYALQLVAIDRLDTQLNEELRNGNVIRMGVEINSAGRPVAYHLLTSHPGESVWQHASGSKYERVQARDLFHLLIIEEAEQTRAVPWAHTAMLTLQNLSGYQEAAIVAARVGASKMGFFYEEETAPGADSLASTSSADGLHTEAEPGSFDVLPAGYRFEGWNPEYPTANYESFVKSTLRSIASGLDVSYNSLANDLEGVNFSSIRAGVLDEREGWMMLQNWFAGVFLDLVYRDWLEMALLAGALVFPNGNALPASKLDKFDAAAWQPRRWPWVDPMKDAQAQIMSINAGLQSRRAAMAEQGRDLDEVWEQLQKEQEMAQSMGISLADLNNKVAEGGDDA